MTMPQSMLTEAIEDHLALKKQNAHLGDSMPLARYDVGDPLLRYPGGPARPAIGDEETAVLPSADVVEGEFRRPLEPLSGMNPMLSLVEDVEDEDDGLDVAVPSAPVATLALEDPQVVRFPGGAGPRGAENAAGPLATGSATGEQPVIVIDADEPLATSTDPGIEPMHPRRTKRPSFFGLRRGRRKGAEQRDGWFTGSPRDFDWND